MGQWLKGLTLCYAMFISGTRLKHCVFSHRMLESSTGKTCILCPRVGTYRVFTCFTGRKPQYYRNAVKWLGFYGSRRKNACMARGCYSVRHMQENGMGSMDPDAQNAVKWLGFYKSRYILPWFMCPRERFTR